VPLSVSYRLRVRLVLVTAFLLPTAMAAALFASARRDDGGPIVAEVVLILLVGLASLLAAREVLRRAQASRLLLLAEVERRTQAEGEVRAAADRQERSNAFLRGVLDVLSDEIIAIDVNHQSMLWNAASRAAYDVGSLRHGDEVDDWIARFVIVRDDGQPLAKDRLPLLRALAGERVTEESVGIFRPGEPMRRMIANGHQVVLDDGEVVGAVVAVRDVTVLRAREEEVRTISQQMDALARAKTELLAGLDPRRALCRAAADIADSLAAILLEPEPGEGALIATAVEGLDLGPITVDLSGTSRAAKVFRTAQSCVVPDVRSDALTDKRIVARYDEVTGDDVGIVAAVYVPVVHDGRVRAVLTVTTSRPWTARDAHALAALELLGADAALALEREDLLRRLEDQALTDPLTALPNRRAWDRALAREVARAQRSGVPFTVAVLDLDRFKAFNDRFGHPAGDQLLVAAARLWQDRVRAGDLVARLGGEEFGVLLPDCTADQAEEIVARLIVGLPQEQTSSAGVAQWAGQSAEDLVAAADGALYDAKHGGRARFAVA
jgi:diguanylate cyclase (GGDEF)-like protein